MAEFQANGGPHGAALPGHPRRKRGPTMAKDVWSMTGPPKYVGYSKFGNPVTGEAKKLLKYLGALARNPQFFPLSTPCFPDMDKENVEKAWREITKRFTTDHPCAKFRIEKIIAKRWRNWKAQAKADFYVPGVPHESIKRVKGNVRINLKQWVALLDYWKTDIAVKESEQNKLNRQKQTMGHTLGTTSLARKGQEVLETEGVEPGRLRLFVISHTRKDGSILQSAASTMEKVTEKVAEAVSSGNSIESIESTGRNDILAQILGKERGGRVRGMEFGATSTNTWGRFRGTSDSNARENALKDELDATKDELGATKTKVGVLEGQVATLQSTCANLQSVVTQLLQCVKGGNLNLNLTTEAASNHGSNMEGSSGSRHT